MWKGRSLRVKPEKPSACQKGVRYSVTTFAAVPRSRPAIMAAAADANGGSNTTVRNGGTGEARTTKAAVTEAAAAVTTTPLGPWLMRVTGLDNRTRSPNAAAIR